MPNTADKVKFNIKNVHYAVLTNGATPTWSTPVAIPGTVSFSLEPQGDTTPFYADGIVYYQSVANNGYSGDLETANFPDSFLKDVFGISEGTTSKVLTESSKVEPKPFALLFEEEGDSTGTKYVLYNCSGTRPKRSFDTQTKTKEPSTQTVTVTAVPLADGKVMAMTGTDTPTETLTAWYTTVFKEAGV